ncbi:MAG: nuA3 HAT complex component nto1 [Thelocarpon impressellum]|nr:MAG: nuA3 HAT complex component nto1 [Thelocarpon impressellum]
MAPLSPTHQRTISASPHTGGRSRGRPRARPNGSSSQSAAPNGAPGPPMKKRRYIPGGPGGGGRYVDIDGTETPVGGTGPGGYAYSGSRGPVGRENAANGVSPRVYPRRRERVAAPRPSYSSAAAVAAAVVHGDGYKPREERGWEEFHPHLDIDASLPVYSADDVDGIAASGPTPPLHFGTPVPDDAGNADAVNESKGSRTPNGNISAQSPGSGLNGDTDDASSKAVNIPDHETSEILYVQPKRRRVGRPVRRSEAVVNGTTTPTGPKVVPLPGPNPREKLTLPKPSFRHIDPFSFFEQKSTGQQRYVDRTMANVGYQESDIFTRPVSRLIRVAEGTTEEDLDLGPSFKSDGEHNTALGGTGVGRVEYDMDEQDDKWLAAYNGLRKAAEVEPITREVFEITMTKIEKEWHALEKRIPKPNPKPPQTHRPRSSSAAAVNGEPAGAAGEEQDSKCAICDDGDCENTNAIVFCDGCDLAVHQECYGVPFIPEGQWLCRKCQLIGRGTPTCIFCPNVDGAFKQTNSSRWSHLLCAIWIPEVTLGNPTFMEPVMDVEKVPRQRWKLTCYICRQRMGACIQCGNKQCFVAFHVTCARRARLFLKMKSSHGGPANLDASVLKAYCDKHVPSEWRRENDVDAATADAQAFYHHTMRGRLWADSQQSALAYIPSQPQAPPGHRNEAKSPIVPRINLALGNKSRKRNQQPKATWKLPSGAPVVPQVVYNSVESSLQRFMIRKRKEYAAEACKYWTLKREARRGAALLKRLQLQMETFTSMEITRRNFAGMGAAGRTRLQRRIDFAEKLLLDVEKLRILCDEVKKREREKLKEAAMLKDVIDTVYFPIAPLLWPILERAQNLDGKGVFHAGFQEIRQKLETRSYTSVSTFSTDLGSVFSAVIGSGATEAVGDVPAQSDVSRDTRGLTLEQKEKRKLAKRIIKAIQGGLEESTRSEAELGGKPFEKELRDLDMLLDSSLLSRRQSLAASMEEENNVERGSLRQLTNGSSLPDGSALESKHHKAGVTTNHASDMSSVGDSTDGGRHGIHHEGATVLSEEDRKAADGLDSQVGVAVANTGPPSNLQEEATNSSGTSNREPHGQTGSRPLSRAAAPQDLVPPTPPMSSEEDLLAPLSFGGIPWYLEPFDPVGTTISEERWTGREVVRGMSEELSEIDEEALSALVDVDMDAEGGVEVADEAAKTGTEDPPRPRSKKGKGGKRWRGYR